jgi:hypothetical protein
MIAAAGSGLAELDDADDRRHAAGEQQDTYRTANAMTIATAFTCHSSSRRCALSLIRYEVEPLRLSVLPVMA